MHLQKIMVCILSTSMILMCLMHGLASTNLTNIQQNNFPRFVDESGITYYTNEEGTIATGITKIFFLNSTLGWAVGYAGLMLCTIDGGKNWSLLTWSGSGDSSWIFKDLEFINETYGWVLGSKYESGLNSFLLNTNDSGATWNLIYTFTDYDIQAFDFIEMKGWMVANYIPQYRGDILYTSDGGVTWTIQDLGNVGYLWFDIKAVDETHVWVVGSDGNIFWTKDGINWGWAEHLGSQYKLRAVDLVNLNYGWIVTDSGEIFYCTYGYNWHMQYDANETLMDVDYINETYGYVVSTKGSIFYSTDGGLTYQKETTGSLERDWRSVFMLEDGRAYFGGGTWKTAFGYPNCLLAVMEKTGSNRDVQLAPTMTLKINDYNVTMEADSTLTDFSISAKGSSLAISFTVFGPNNVAGYCNITIPKSTLDLSELNICLDETTANYTITETATDYIISMTYRHSIHRISLVTFLISGGGSRHFLT